VRGATDPDSGVRTRVTPGAHDVSLDFGLVGMGLQPTEGGDAVPAADGFGTWLVATIEVEVRPGLDLHLTPTPRRAPVELAGPRAVTTKPWGGKSALRVHSRRLDTARARSIQVSLRFEGLTGGIESRFAPGTHTDWGAQGPAGVPLGPSDTLVFTAPPHGGLLVHQIALFVPGTRPGPVTGRAVYTARTMSAP